MGDRLADFGPDAAVVLITFTRPEELVTYRREHDLPFPVVVDAERAAYRRYGLGRTSTARVWSAGTLRRYAQILRRDGFGTLRRPTEDTRQLGGDFVVDRDGRLAWGFWSEGPDDRPSVDELVRAVRS